MTDVLWLVIILYNLPAYASDTEQPCERWDRMATVARALDDASSRLTCSGRYAATDERPCTPEWTGKRRDLILWGVTMGWWETRFAQHVHEGRCRSYECDAHVWRDAHGRVLRIEHRARSPWQIQRHALTATIWHQAEGVGLPETTRAAWGALRVVSRGAKCGSDLGIVSSYMRSRCRPSDKLRPHVLDRVAWHRRLDARDAPVTSRPQCAGFTMSRHSKPRAAVAGARLPPKLSQASGRLGIRSPERL